MQLQATAKFISATVLLSAIAAALGVGPLYAAQDANEVAIVENVSGHVVAFVAGKPALLEALDVVSDGTRLDLQANSELRICHYQTRQFLTGGFNWSTQHLLISLDEEVADGDVTDIVHGEAKGRTLGALEERTKCVSHLPGAGKEKQDRRPADRGAQWRDRSGAASQGCGGVEA